VLEFMVAADVPLLPPFPAGEAKLESFRRGLEQEGEAGVHAIDLLDAQAEQERALGS
jgi:pyruvate dehydrogenase (quinone)